MRKDYRDFASESTMPLFDRQNLDPPHNGTPTSSDAANSVKGIAAAQRSAVLEAIRESVSGLTDEEIQELTGINPNAERPRRGELVGQYFVRDSGRTKLTRSGRKAILWEVVR